jgi:hypothetical protein
MIEGNDGQWYGDNNGPLCLYPTVEAGDKEENQNPINQIHQGFGKLIRGPKFEQGTIDPVKQ